MGLFREKLEGNPEEVLEDLLEWQMLTIEVAAPSLFVPTPGIAPCRGGAQSCSDGYGTSGALSF